MAVADRRLSLAELAEESGVPARTIRYYIARGLLEGPETAGRGASYGERHLERLRQIRELQGKGLTLAEIARRLGGGGTARELPPSVACWQYQPAPDVTVLVRADSPPWRLRQVHAALRALAVMLSESEDGEQQRQGGIDIGDFDG